MRDPERIDRILKKIGDKWKKSPDMRLIQLLIALSTTGTLYRTGKDKPTHLVYEPDPFYIEDEELEKSLGS